MAERRFTNLARAVDIKYPTNLAVVILSSFVFFAAGIFQWAGGLPLLAALGAGFSLGLTFFLAWALAREIDPDQEYSAFLSAGMVLVGVLWLGPADNLVLFWAIVILRLVSRCVGLPMTWFDSFSILGLSAWLTWQEHVWVGGITVAAFLLDAILPKPDRKSFLFAGLMLVLTVVISFVNPPEFALGVFPVPLLLLLVVTSVLFVWVVTRAKQINSVGDATGVPLNSIRVRESQVLLLTAAVLVTVLVSSEGLPVVFPFWLVMLGTGLYQIGILFKSPI